MKFRLLAMKQDMAGTGAQLKTMFELFPTTTKSAPA